MPKTYTVAIAGLGKRGKVHADLFFKNPRFQVVGVADVDADRVKDAAAICGNPEGFADTGEMLKAVKPDVFCFCTPPPSACPSSNWGATRA